MFPNKAPKSAIMRKSLIWQRIRRILPKRDDGQPGCHRDWGRVIITYLASADESGSTHAVNLCMHATVTYGWVSAMAVSFVRKCPRMSHGRVLEPTR